ncbi:MAG: pyruvate, phosphate dikinase, partial [Bellilinea sp.]
FNEVNAVEKVVGGDWEGVRALLGGKGANLAEMTRLGIPVPPGFTITTEACNAYLAGGNKFPEGLWDQVLVALKETEKASGKKFGGSENPLLVSCRSGAKFSMPGMMDTVLNIGLNDQTAAAMVKLTNNERFVYDSYRRLVQMFGAVVLEMPDEAFEDVLIEFKAEKKAKSDTDLTAEDLKELTDMFKKVVRKHQGFDFPSDPMEQLKLAAEAVFRSWNGKRAVDYRNATKIAHDLGTAVNIQTMVFGNTGNDSATGVAFTRDPATGEKKMYGDYLLNAQGEDVVAGIRNTEKIQHLAKDMPEAYAQFLDITAKLEKHYKDMQDVEFTIENKHLYMLQTRNGKRTSRAAVKTAVDMVNEGLITKEEALRRVRPEDVDTLLHPQFSPETIKAAKKANQLFAVGVNASPGAAVGQVYFDADTTERMFKEHHQDVLMVRPFTKPDDVHGMLAAKGIVTSEGGATSHAAVVARQFGVPCVVGASSIRIDLDKRLMEVNGQVVHEGEWMSMDGTSGEVFIGKLKMTDAALEEQTDLMTLLTWADEICARPGLRKGPAGSPTTGLQVWTNADYPKDAVRARKYGAKGIGLCRTEHMFFEPQRLPVVQRMILAKTSEERTEALNELLPHQRADFEGLFEAMTGLPVIIRLIDPPLHEFLPAASDLEAQIITSRVNEMAGYLLGKSEPKEIKDLEMVLEAVESLHESNPMMGMRGVRLSIAMPEIVEMQVRAIFEAACNVKLKGLEPKPEVMIPLTGHVNELKWVQPRLERIAKAVMEEKGVTELHYKFGTMIEIPRACVTADEIAEVAEFFSFGTNDLTQMTFGYSRDDAERNFLVTYVEQGILPKNPFQTIDFDGVGGLMKIAVEKGRTARPNLEVGICGEHGGDPESIEFCHTLGNNYVSCSPFRVPVARLAAAHAALKHAAK